MNNVEANKNAQVRRYYVRKPCSNKDFLFLDAVNRLMGVWDTCGSNRMDKLVEIFKTMSKEPKYSRFDCNDFIEIFESYKTGFISQDRILPCKNDHNGSLELWISLLSGEIRYKFVKEIYKFMDKPYFVLYSMASNELSTLQDFRDACESGLFIDKDVIDIFKDLSQKEYNKAKPEEYAKITNLVHEIVTYIENSSYMRNTQYVHSMYKKFGIPDRQIKKADFLKLKDEIVKNDTAKIMESLKINGGR